MRAMPLQEETEITAVVEMNVDLDLREPEPVSEEILDRHSDEVTEVLEREGAELALGLVVSLDIPNSTIGLMFDVLGDTDAEIYEKLAEISRMILRETRLPLRVARVEAKEIDAEARAADRQKQRGGSDQEAAA
jgi:hypothetical protein